VPGAFARGDLGNGIVLPGLYCDAFPAPSDQPDLVCFAFADGAWIGYDPVRHALAVTLPEGGTAALDAPGGLTIHGDVTVNGSLTASGDVVGRGFPQGPPAFRRAGRQWPDRGAGMSSLYKISWTKRVCYCRLFVWAAYSVRNRRYGGLIWILWHPREWFKFGSGLDCD
jgi:hypothetical protein